MSRPSDDNRRRTEPSLGHIDALTVTDAPTSRYRTSAQSATSSRRAWPIALFLILLLSITGGLVWKYQDRLRTLLPNTQLNELLTRAQKALHEDKLIGTQGDSARELFQAARSLDADNDVARTGLNQVGEKLLEHAKAALQRNDLTDARQSLEMARELLGGGITIDEVEQALQRTEAQHTEIEALLTKAQSALEANRILGENGSAAYYQRVLTAQQDNALAQAGLKKSADALANQARNAITANNFDLAATRIENIARISPNYPALPELRGQLTKQRTASATALADKLKLAETQLRNGHIAKGEDSALALYQAVLAQDAKNTVARAGLRKVAQALVTQANAEIDDNNPTQASTLLAQAQKLAPDLPELRAAKSELRELQERIDIAAARPTLTAEQQQRVKKLIAEAAQAAAAGNLIIPPSVSAYDKYRAALHIDANNSAALDGLNKLPVRAKELFSQALKDSTPNRARTMFDAVRQLAPDDAKINTMQEQLANAYLDQVEKYIEQNRRTDALHVLNIARELSPNNMRLTSIEQKLRVLSANGNT